MATITREAAYITAPMIITATTGIIIPGGRGVTIIMTGTGIITTVRPRTATTMTAGAVITTAEGVTITMAAAPAIMATVTAVTIMIAGMITVPGKGLGIGTVLPAGTDEMAGAAVTDSGRRKNRSSGAWSGQSRRKALSGIYARSARNNSTGGISRAWSRARTRSSGSKKPGSGRRSGSSEGINPARSAAETALSRRKRSRTTEQDSAGASKFFLNFRRQTESAHRRRRKIVPSE